MRIHFLGGSDEVGASCILVEIGGQNILVDAGIRVSPKARDGLLGELLPDLSPLSHIKLDAVIITHAHADHIGAIPLVLGSMPDVPVYTTPATISIMSVMFRDALRIMDSRLEAEGELPHYDLLQVQRVEAACRPTDFRQEFSVNGNVNVTFYRAGHIPGAASVFLQGDDGSILISGDLSFSPMRATPIAEIPAVRPDVLVLESTYGGRLHANRIAEEGRIIDDIKAIIENDGRVLIPAFALGRAQEVALILDSAIARRKLPRVPVYMDGMTRSITQVFERFPEYLSKQLGKHLEDSLSIFQSDSVHFVRSRDERQQIASDKKPAVIIASSGMLTGGASPFYAQEIVKEKNSAIFITGYQDEESPGKALQRLASEKAGTIILYGKKFQVECRIDTYSLSAHADENELTQYAVQMEPQQIFMVHGDGDARMRMRELIRQRRLAVSLVKLGQVVEIEGNKPLGRRKDVPTVPQFSTPPITNLEEIDVGLPIFDVEGNVYVRNAKKAIRKLLPPECGLRKMTFNKNDKQVKLSFDFPDVAKVKYADQLNMVKQLMGWDVVVNDSVNMMALNTIAKKVIPDLIGRVSIHMAARVIEAKVQPLPSAEIWRATQDTYLKETGFRLVLKGSREQFQNAASIHQSQPIGSAGGAHLEINEAYGVIKNSLRDKGLYKAGLKNGVIVLSFMTPEQGYALHEELQILSEQTGYMLDIHPHPNQHDLIQLVNEMCDNEDIILIKNPSVMLAEKVMTIEPNTPIASDLLENLKTAFYEKTGWELRDKTTETA